MKKFMTINETSKETGLSTYYLRMGARNGSIPFIMAGDKYLINVPALLDMLDAESRANCAG